MAEYIEREALLTELAKGTIISDDLYGMGIMAGVDAAMKKVVQQPAADVSPVVHGRWIVDGSGVVICSECGAEHEWLDYRATFCEDCGAKMDGGKNDAEK